MDSDHELLQAYACLADIHCFSAWVTAADYDEILEWCDDQMGTGVLAHESFAVFRKQQDIQEFLQTNRLWIISRIVDKGTFNVQIAVRGNSEAALFKLRWC